MNKLLSKEKMINSVLILYVLSIFLDLHIFYNSISTLIRLGFISLIFVIVFLKDSTRKERKIFLIYFLFLLIYIMLHLINANKFNISVPTSFNNLSELLYFYKMIMNIFIIYIVYKLNIDLKLFSKTLKISLWLISGSILLTNVFKLGYSTYNFEPITGNIFSWFSSNENTFESISGKGYFHLANQIIAIILLYYPLLLNEVKENFKLNNILLSIVVLLSMLILGNRLSTIGPLMILLLSFVIYVFLVFIKKEAFNYKFFSFLLISIIMYNIFLFNSPLLTRESYYNDMINNNISLSSIEDNNDNIENEVDDLLSRIDKQLINRNFPLKYYKYENDPEFWEEMLTKSSDILSNSRYIEISIINRVKTLNNNPSDKWLGIGYDRIINIFNIERDYVMQYYSVGIIGSILLLGIYFIIYFYSILKIIINLESKLIYKNIMLILSVGIFLIAAYFSGNLLNSISSIIPISFVLAILLNEVKVHQNKDNRILGFEICSLEEDEIIKRINADIKKNISNIIFNINPIIITNFYKDKDIVKEFNKEKYQIPDGIGTVMASKMKDGNIYKRITGVDFFEKLCQLAVKENQTICLYGGKIGVADLAKLNIEKKYKDIKITKVINGYISEEKALKEILKAKPDMLFIALGSPKQENFILKNKNNLKNIKVIMPVGGTLDVISGNLNRAPKVFVKTNSEWLYRMIKQPKRVLVNTKLIIFVFMVIFKNNCYNSRSRVN